ncbi:alpha/beta hydrolase [Mucilaginibacter sp. dw_454]|uniref:alpha/beta fold hydrolase n=1 Tax=Mucilaginibacter sp. dw_454 TaxID=2720079 RepID=UPI001BD5F601|nr:alpha/beta hydrolase [Mucilaginibacter sp. dw_454]
MNKRLLRLILLLIAVLTANNLYAQGTFGSFFHASTEQGCAGTKFRYKAFVRSERDDTDAAAYLWVKAGKNRNRGLYSKPIQTNEWKEVSIEGTIDEDYKQILFGVLGEYNGRIYVDDISLEVQTKDKTWKSIYKTGFEKNDDGWKAGSGDSLGVNHLFKGELSSTNPHSGKECFLIYSKGIPNYGTNGAVGKYANVNGVKIYYEIYGEGHPLVVLHGNGGSIKDAAPFYPELLKKYKVIAIDSRAQGKSTDTDAPLTYDLMASDINALLDELKIDSTFIWGHSDGAILGLIMAMKYPKKVEKLLAVGANIQPDSTAIFSWALNYSKKIVKESSDVKERKLNQLMLDYPNIPFSDLSGIKIPVLIMAGDRDDMRPEHTLKLFQNIPKSQLCILPGTTHAGPWEKKDLFFELLFDFFDKPFTMPTTEDWFK